jgi:hypothetical protein
MGLLLGPSDSAPTGDDWTVIAHADPSAPCMRAMRVEREVHGALGSHGGIGRVVPAHERFVVPEAQLAPLAVATFLDRYCPLGIEL